MADNTGIWSALLNAFAEELSLFDDAFLTLTTEAIPGLSDELLTDWERVLGLPDTCSSLAGTIAERQAVVHAKYTTKYSGLSASFYIDYASKMGTSIVINENYGGGTPFRVDNSRVDRTPLDGIDGARVWSTGIYSTWEVQISASDPNKNYLQCYFNVIKPAHTELVWTEV